MDEDEVCTCRHLLSQHETNWEGADIDSLTPYWVCTKCACSDFHNVKEQHNG